MTEDPNVIFGPPLERAIYSSLGELLLMLLNMHENKILQIDARTGEELPASLILNRAKLLAMWLQEKNLGPGDCISISSENRLEFCIVPLAAFLTGITLVPLNPEYTQGEIKHVLSLSKPKLIFCSKRTIQQVMAGRSDYPYLKDFVLFDEVTAEFGDVICYKSIIKDATTDFVIEFEPTPIDPEENVAVILCSSGTTGLPKGVMTTHYNITILIEIIRLTLQRNIAEQDDDSVPEVVTAIAPFFHGMGFMSMILAMVGRRVMVVYSRFDPVEFLESISKYRITTLLVPPPIVVFLIKHPMVDNYDLSSITEVKSGAASLGKAVERKVAERFRLTRMNQNYGLTETTLGVLLPGDVNKLGSVGKVVPGMKCKVIDSQGNSLGPNKEGELCFQGPLVMKGYVNDPKATAETIDKYNWLHTGDIGYYDSDEDFFIVDRLKELIKYKGFQVAPAELEALLTTHKAVADAAVVGKVDESVGELPVAFVVKKPYHNITGADLEKFVADRVSSAKHLRGGVRFVESIPRNPSGKILRRVLREQVNKVNSKL